jgi:cell envelope opacity-associated protein A
LEVAKEVVLLLVQTDLMVELVAVVQLLTALQALVLPDRVLTVELEVIITALAAAVVVVVVHKVQEAQPLQTSLLVPEGAELHQLLREHLLPTL